MLGAAGAFIVRNYFFEEIYLASDSMAPTLPVGTRLWVHKRNILSSSFLRGDIVMFERPGDSTKGLVKRIIALGGDEIAIRDKRVFLNGQELDEPYTQFVRKETLLLGDNIPPTLVPPNMVFVMGDNRDVSGDSRDWKSPSGQWDPFLPVSAIQGVISK
jgi:signal peptidase I